MSGDFSGFNQAFNQGFQQSQQNAMQRQQMEAQAARDEVQKGLVTAQTGEINAKADERNQVAAAQQILGDIIATPKGPKRDEKLLSIPAEQQGRVRSMLLKLTGEETAIRGAETDISLKTAANSREEGLQKPRVALTTAQADKAKSDTEIGKGRLAFDKKTHEAELRKLDLEERALDAKLKGTQAISPLEKQQLEIRKAGLQVQRDTLKQQGELAGAELISKNLRHTQSIEAQKAMAVFQRETGDLARTADFENRKKELEGDRKFRFEEMKEASSLRLREKLTGTVLDSKIADIDRSKEVIMNFLAGVPDMERNIGQFLVTQRGLSPDKAAKEAAKTVAKYGDNLKKVMVNFGAAVQTEGLDDIYSSGREMSAYTPTLSAFATGVMSKDPELIQSAIDSSMPSKVKLRVSKEVADEESGFTSEFMTNSFENIGIKSEGISNLLKNAEQQSLNEDGQFDPEKAAKFLNGSRAMKGFVVISPDTDNPGFLHVSMPKRIELESNTLGLPKKSTFEGQKLSHRFKAGLDRLGNDGNRLLREGVDLGIIDESVTIEELLSRKHQGDLANILINSGDVRADTVKVTRFPSVKGK